MFVLNQASLQQCGSATHLANPSLNVSAALDFRDESDEELSDDVFEPPQDEFKVKDPDDVFLPGLQPALPFGCLKIERSNYCVY